MAIDPLNPASLDDAAATANSDARARRLNTWVAITVALLATFMGICKVRDDNLVQAMQQAQADKIDHWSFYQARNIRQQIAQTSVDQLELVVSGQPAAMQANAVPLIAKYKALVAEQQQKKEELRKQAVADQTMYDGLNFHDDQFDLADALTAIAISLLALTSLTQRRWLFWVALTAALFGVVMGLAGLLSWQLHPDALSRLLS
jgi:glutathione S-transferase